MKKAKDILSKLLDENSRDKARSYSSVFGGWRDLAGLSLADHSRVYEIRHNNLFVEVDHNGWMQILLLRKPRILSRLRSRYPELEIRDLKVRVNPAISLSPEVTDDASSARQASTSSARQASTSSARQASTSSARQASTSSARQARDAQGVGSQEEAVDQVVSDVPQESLKRQLKKLFLSSLKHRRDSS